MRVQKVRSNFHAYSAMRKCTCTTAGAAPHPARLTSLIAKCNPSPPLCDMPSVAPGRVRSPGLARPPSRLSERTRRRSSITAKAAKAHRTVNPQLSGINLDSPRAKPNYRDGQRSARGRRLVTSGHGRPAVVPVIARRDRSRLRFRASMGVAAP